MAKNSKKPVVNHGRPITSFFTRSTKTPTSSQGSPSLSQTKATNLSSMPEDSPSTKPAATGPRKVELQSRQSPLKNATQAVQYTVASSAGPSRKRTRSPDVNSPSQTLRSTPTSRDSNSPLKDKLENDTDVEMGDPVAHVKTTPQPPIQSRKKPRVSSPLKVAMHNVTEVVPSSQSDEEPPFSEMNIDVPPIVVHDSQPSSPSATPNRRTESNSSTGLGTTFSSPGRMHTPPSSDLPSLPVTPVALDVASKTAKIIADIKARAYARNTSSPEPVLEFNDTLESSSEEEDIIPLNIIERKPPSPKTTSSVEPSRRSTRLRSRTGTKISPSEASTSKLPAPKAKASPKSRTKKPAQSVPFEALLKEKRTAEKRGNGTAVFDRAEGVANNIDADNFFLDDIDLEEEEPLTWDPSSRAARDTPWLSGSKQTTTPGLNRITIPDIELDSEDQKRRFGEERAKEIADMLQHDSDEQHTLSSANVMGIKIWTTLPFKSDLDDNAMIDDTFYFITQLPGTDPVIQYLNLALARHDFSHAALLLNTDIINIISPSERMEFVSSICDLALRAGTNALAESAVPCLEQFWSSDNQPSTSSISFAQILDTLCRLKINNGILLEQQWQPTNTIDDEIDDEHRRVVTDRLIVLITACARTKRLQKRDLVDILMTLVLLAINIDASAEFIQDVTQTIDLVCGCISPADLETQLAICSKFLNCVAPYSPTNKYRAISLLAGGSGTARKIANTVAYYVIVDKVLADKDMLSQLPPLSDILDELPPNSKSKGPTGKFSVHDGTDYIDLGLYVCILAVAVSDVKGYTFQDGGIANSNLARATPSPIKNLKEQLTDVQNLHSALENLHSSINDMRAAYLERSRTKAIIKGLSMNVFYQHTLWSSRFRAKPPKVTINKWLNKKDKA